MFIEPGRQLPQLRRSDIRRISLLRSCRISGFASGIKCNRNPLQAPSACVFVLSRQSSVISHQYRRERLRLYYSEYTTEISVPEISVFRLRPRCRETARGAGSSWARPLAPLAPLGMDRFAVEV